MGRRVVPAIHPFTSPAVGAPIKSAGQPPTSRLQGAQSSAPRRPLAGIAKPRQHRLHRPATTIQLVDRLGVLLEERCWFGARRTFAIFAFAARARTHAARRLFFFCCCATKTAHVTGLEPALTRCAAYVARFHLSADGSGDRGDCPSMMQQTKVILAVLNPSPPLDRISAS